METPLERRAKLISSHAFVKVPEPVLALLAFSAKPVTVKNHHVTFTLRGKGYTFAQGGAEALHGRNGEQIVAYFDEQSMASIYCFTREGAYLGAVKQLGGQLALKDSDAISAAAEQLRDFYQREVKGPVDTLLAADRAQAEADRAQNETRLVQWRLKAPADDEKKKPSLSKTLATTSSPPARPNALPPPIRSLLASPPAPPSRLMTAAAERRASRREISPRSFPRPRPPARTATSASSSDFQPRHSTQDIIP